MAIMLEAPQGLPALRGCDGWTDGLIELASGSPQEGRSANGRALHKVHWLPGCAGRFGMIRVEIGTLTETEARKAGTD